MKVEVPAMSNTNYKDIHIKLIKSERKNNKNIKYTTAQKNTKIFQNKS